MYSLDKPLSFYKLYSSNANDVPSFNNTLARELTTVLSTLNDNPYVCYTSSSARAAVCMGRVFGLITVLRLRNLLGFSKGRSIMALTDVFGTQRRC